MKAGNSFKEYVEKLKKEKIKNIKKIQIDLHGSLSATGKGHGTHRAIAMVVMGVAPHKCDSDFLLNMFEKENDSYELKFQNKIITIKEQDISFRPLSEAQNFPYANTLVIKLLDSKKSIVIEKEYYSIGGGFIKCKDEKEPKRNKPKYLYSNFNELRAIIEEKNISLAQVILENEMAITGSSKKEIYKDLKQIIKAMIKSVENGLKTKQTVLPGDIKLQRRAKEVYDSVKLKKHILNKHIIYLNSYALAASEENAAGKIVVTAPTSGSSGLIPGIIYFLIHQLKESEKNIIKSMLCAAAISFIARENASIAGAEVGCQGEVGVAAAMGAALMASINNEPINIIESSATIALEHFLGLTCDPIGGYVQIPCIERNAIGALQSYNSYTLASCKHHNILRFDEVVKTMLQTGKDMNSKYKETAKGGLAVYTSIKC
jgi:L-serine dehydratase